MALPLAAGLAVLLAFQASAEPAPKNPKEFKLELTQGFNKGTDLAVLDAAGQDVPLVQLYDQAKYVQAGREPGDEKETHIAFIRSVARRLGARPDLAVQLYGDRTRPPRAGAASQREIDARAAVALDVKRNPGISEAKKARLAQNLRRTSESLQKGMNVDFAVGAGPKDRPAELNILIPDSLPRAPAPGGPEYLPNGERNWSSLPPRVQPYPNASNPTPSPNPDALSSLPSAMTRMVYSLAELSSFIDVKRGAEVAYEAVSGVIEEGKKAVHRCYNFVKQALIDAGVIDAPNPQSTAIIGLRPGAAEMFNTDVQKNPQILNRLGYRRAKLGGLSKPSEVPAGSILIYGAGCGYAYYDKKVGKFVDHGHAELTVPSSEYERVRAAKDNRQDRARGFTIGTLEDNDVPACHYTCTGRSISYLNTKGAGDKACLRMYVPVKPS